jgi:hypothetical protein
MAKARGSGHTLAMKIKTTFLCTAVGLTVVLLKGQAPTTIDFRGTQTALEYTGQVTNSGIASIQVGYFSYVKGIGNAFSGMPQDESTAMFTFYTSVNTTRNVLNGSIRLVVREGTTTIYLAKGASDFINPDSFRSGTPIQSSSMRQQVLVDTVTGGFTVSNYNVINSATSFTLNGVTYQLGAPGQSFRTSLTGHLTATAPPSGYFGGYAVASDDSGAFLSATPDPAAATNSNGYAQVTVTWGAPGVPLVEVHVGAPDGVLFTGGGSSGTVTTGAWVSNGMTFYLQDVSTGNPLSAANTLAKTTVIVIPAGSH